MLRPSRIKTMRIAEIIFWNNEPTEMNRFDPHSPTAPFSDDPTNLANAFTRRGLVKHFWNLNGSEGQPTGPVPPDAGTELIPSGLFHPTTASWEAEPVETERPVSLNRLRFGNSAADQPPTRQPNHGCSMSSA